MSNLGFFRRFFFPIAVRAAVARGYRKFRSLNFFFFHHYISARVSFFVCFFPGRRYCLFALRLGSPEKSLRAELLIIVAAAVRDSLS